MTVDTRKEKVNVFRHYGYSCTFLSKEREMKFRGCSCLKYKYKKYQTMEITFKVLLENGIRSRQLCQFWERERLNIFPSNFINFQPFFPFLYFIPFRIFHTTFIPFLLFLPVLLESKRIGTRVSISTSSSLFIKFRFFDHSHSPFSNETKNLRSSIFLLDTRTPR